MIDKQLIEVDQRFQPALPTTPLNFEICSADKNKLEL